MDETEVRRDEVQPEDARPDEGRPNGAWYQKRSRWAMVLLTVATVVAMVATITTWTHVQALDTDEFVELSTEILAEPEVQSAVAVFLVDTIYERLDLGAQLGELRDNDTGLFGDLGGLVIGALREPAIDAVERVLASDKAQAIWEDSVRVAHAAAVAVLREETHDGVSADDGAIVLELGELGHAVGAALGLPDVLLERIPDDAWDVVIFESDELDDAQQAVQLFDFLSWFLIVLVVGLYVAAVVVAPAGRRARTTQSIGLSLVFTGVVMMIIRQISIRAAIDALVNDPTKKPVGTVVGLVSTELLLQISAMAIVYGVLIAGTAWFLGAPGVASSLRTSVAPMVRGPLPVVIAAETLLVLLLLWWSPARAFDRLIPSLLLIAIVVAGTVATRRGSTAPATA